MTEFNARAVFLTRFGIAVSGGGAKHRGYQILADLRQMLGQENVHVIHLAEWRKEQESLARKRIPHWLAWRLRSLKLRLVAVSQNPARIFASTPYNPQEWIPTKFWAEYQTLIRSTPGPLLCVVDDARLGHALAINRRHCVQTIICPHNLESLDRGMLDGRDALPLAQGVDFVHEMNKLAEAERSLFISKTEYALSAGLGHGAAYYPYLPMGEIREGLQMIAQRRLQTAPEAGLFLLMGSANHQSTRSSMLWLVENIRSHGLPPDARVICVGRGTDNLIATSSHIPGVEVLGWVDQQALDNLLARATAVLVPYLSGFGALTRLPEMSCAGVPVIASRLSVAALNPPPGITLVENDWVAWWNAMAAHLAGKIYPAVIPPDEYTPWEAQQPKALQETLRQLLDTPGSPIIMRTRAVNDKRDLFIHKFALIPHRVWQRGYDILYNLRKRTLFRRMVIIVGSSHRVGSTWLVHLLRGATHCQMGRWTTPKEFLRFGTICLHADSYRYLQGMKGQVIFKSHSLPPEKTENARGIRFVTIYRDPRDVLTSAIYFLAHLEDERGGLGAQFRCLAITERLLWLIENSEYLEELEQWYRTPFAYKIRYEDLYKDPRKVIADTVRWLGLPVEDAEISRVVRHHSFEAATGRKPGQEQKNHPKRKGITGDWRNHFDDACISAFKTSRDGRWNALLLEMGYEQNPDWGNSL